jgi:hypothetical protein
MAAPWTAIIQAVEKKKDRIGQALSGLANSQAQIAQGFGGTSFNPVTNQNQPLATNGQGGLFPRVLNYFGDKNNEQSPQNYGAIGQSIMQQAPSANSLYDYLMMR